MKILNEQQEKAIRQFYADFKVWAEDDANYSTVPPLWQDTKYMRCFNDNDARNVDDAVTFAVWHKLTLGEAFDILGVMGYTQTK